MKQGIDRITKDLIAKCREIEKQRYELLLKYEKDLESLYTQLNNITDECKDTLKTANNVLIIDIEKDTQKALKLPYPPEFKTFEFNSVPTSYKQLQDEFGCLSVKEGQMFVPLESDYAPKSDVVKKYRSSDSTVVSEFEHSTCITSVVKSTSDSVWLSYGNDKYISRITLKGEVKQKLQLTSDIYDISVSPVTGNLWLCCSDNAVYEAAGDKPTKRFPIAFNFPNVFCPWHLCITPENNVVVSTTGCVRVFSTTGQVLHTTQGSGSDVSQHHVTACSRTGNIAVCDKDWSLKGGKHKPHVSVFNSKLHLKYQYYGPPASVMKPDFWPNDVVFDTQGGLLIADNYNKCIQLVSGEEQFLTVIHTDTLHPMALTLMQDGLLCVGFDGKRVKVIRYRV